MAHKLETLAKLYLEGKSVEISDIAQQELCDWLIGEFQQLLSNPIFSDYMRDQNAAEMCADIAQEKQGKDIALASGVLSLCLPKQFMLSKRRIISPFSQHFLQTD